MRKVDMSPSEPRHKVQRYTTLFVWKFIVDTLFHTTIIVTMAGVVLLIWAIFDPPESVQGDWWFLLLCAILVIPMYYLSRYVKRHLSEAKRHLEQGDSVD